MTSIRVSVDGHFLARSDGRPFFWLADTAWQLFNRLDRDETDEYLADRAARGFSVIQAIASGTVFDDWIDAPNHAGHPPFLDRNPLLPNPDYFDHLEWVIGRAEHHGLRIGLLPVWGLAAVSGSERLLDVGNARPYARWLAERLRVYDLIWVLGGDTTPMWYADDAFEERDGQTIVRRDAAPVDYRAVYDEMAAGIRGVLGDEVFITYHPTGISPPGAPPPRTSLYFGDREWLDMNMLETSHSDHGWADADGGLETAGMAGYRWNAPHSYLPIGAEYRSMPTRPVVDGEPRYEDHPSGRGTWRAIDVRHAAYHALFAGAAGHTYGHVSVWDFYDADVGSIAFKDVERQHWRDALTAPGADDMRHARDLLLSRPYFSRIPDDTVLAGQLGEGSEHRTATRDEDRSWLLAYTPYGEGLVLTPEAVVGDDLREWWFDPRTGETHPTIAFSLANGFRRYVPPTAREDWVLAVEDASRGYPPPGERRAAASR